jgi:hypothetical protein
MMKKVVLCILVIISVLCVSCADKKTKQLGTYTNDDMVLILNNNTFNFGEDASKLLDYLGEPNEVSQILSCYYDGYDKIYKYDNLEVVTFPKDDKDILNEVLFYDDTYIFKGGVKVGSTKDEVIKSYGDKFLMESDAMIYNTETDKNDNKSPHLTFIFKDNVVITMDFYSGSYFS